ncbi:DUF4124 domain-containing protein [Pseudomonas sp. F1_0610]|uniref:DUF4124 domain-containing protein n=1 Tax=Pseudomonas sp. F1_0610 TaxID=3114284 RepID=UPI0039C0D8CF
MRLFICFLLTVIAVPTWAQVYTYIDEYGDRVFTDSPPKGQPTEKVQLAPRKAAPVANSTNTAPPSLPLNANAVQAQVAPAAGVVQENPRYLLRILSPEPDGTVRANDRNVLVTVATEPELQNNHQYRVFLDGKMVSTASRSPVFNLPEVDRGTHMLAVEIIDQHGLIIERTPAQPFHLRQITLADKRRVTPCKYKEYGVRPECPLKDKPKQDPDKPPLLGRILAPLFN